MSILQNILDKVGGQVNEEFFRQQLIQKLGSTTLMMMLRIQVVLLLANYIFYNIKHKQNNHIMTCIRCHM